MDIKKLLTRALLGGALGAGAGFGHRYYTGATTYGSPVLGAELGAGLGAFLEALRQNKEEKNKNVKTKERLTPGLYYMERGIWGDQTLLKGTAFHNNARHGFYVGVYDEKPEGIETQKLPNGQYVVTFGGYPSSTKGSGIGDLYLAINGKSKTNGIDSPNDFVAIKSLMDPDIQRSTDYAATIRPVNLDRDQSDAIVRKMYNLVKNYENTSFGQYHAGLFGTKANNCLTVLGSLTNSMKNDLNLDKLPEHFGGLGGFTKKDIGRLPELSFYDKPAPTAKVVAAHYEQFQRAARHVLRQRLAVN